MTRKKLLIAAVILAAAGVTGASAGQDFEFKYHAHELETDGGRLAVMKRLDRSAGAACNIHKRASIPQRRASVRCHVNLMDTTVAGIPDARFQALYDETARYAENTD